MIKINLLPPEVLKKQAENRVVVLISLGMTLILVIATCVLILRITTDKILSAEITKLESEVKQYQTAVDEVKKLKSITATLEAKKNLIENLKKKSLMYPKFMEKILSLLPPQIWFTSFDSQSKPDGFTVSLLCSSYDNFAIADFIYNLENSSEFSNIELGNITSSITGSGLEIYSFQLKFEYKPQ